MINEKILFLTHTDCAIPELKKHGLGIDPVFDYDAYFVQPLKEVFSKVIVYDIWKSYAEIGVRKSNEKIIDIVCAEQPKYLLWPSMMYEIVESTFQKIREQKTLVVGWFFDDEVRFGNYSRWWIPFLDYSITNDKEAVKKYEESGISAKHVVLGSNPNIFRKLDVNLIYDVTFVGRNFGQRAIWINNMIANGIKVQTFGRGWTNSYVTTEEMVKIFNASKINLNFSESYDRNKRPQIKNRIFDICMAGGFLLCEYAPGIEDYFEIDKEIVCFKNLNEAIYKIQYFINHEEERLSIAQSGWKRAHSDYTQIARLIDTFEEISNILMHRKRDAADYRTPFDMPLHIRQLPSSYHFRWAKGLMIEGFPCKRWREELDFALFYDPSNKKALRLRLIGRLPASLRHILLYCMPAYIKLKQLLRSYLASIPMLRKMKKVLTS